MAGFDRAELIELLERLGAESDATVLEAARALHRRAAESGLNWDDLLALDADSDTADLDDVASADEAAEGGTSALADDGDLLRLIERLLRRDISDALRDDLTEMRQGLADGSFDAMDRRYLRALARRLGV